VVPRQPAGNPEVVVKKPLIRFQGYGAGVLQYGLLEFLVVVVDVSEEVVGHPKLVV